QELLEDQRENGLDLARVTEGADAAAAQLRQLLAQHRREGRHGFAALGRKAIGFVELGLKTRVRPTFGEVQVSQQCLPGDVFGVAFYHRGSPFLCAAAWYSVPVSAA